MEIFQLRYFVAAAKALHFTRAAEELYVSQPSLSLQIGKLEAELGAALFHRQGRRVTLTDAGAALLPLAQRILDQEAEARSVVHQVAGLERGRLSLCALPALDQHLLPPLLASFRRDYPDVEIRVRELRPARAVAQAVIAGQADLGFVHLPYAPHKSDKAQGADRSDRSGRADRSDSADTSDRMEGLCLRRLLDDPFALVVPEGHPFAGRASVALAEGAGEEFVWVHDAQDADHPLYAACLKAGFVPRIVCESGSAQGILALVAAGLGIALLPRLAIEPRTGTRTVPLVPAPSRTLAVLWNADALSHAAEAFLKRCAPGSAGVPPPWPAP